ncbi:hypothetical protein V2A60_008742 [Cordyceps javanica]
MDPNGKAHDFADGASSHPRVVRCPCQGLVLGDDVLKRLDIFSKQNGLHNEVENVANASNAPSRRIEVQLWRDLAHRRIVIRCIIEGEATHFVLDAEGVNNVEDLSSDIFAEASFHQLRNAPDPA